MKKTNAFTFIEVMIACAIMLLLVGITVPLAKEFSRTYKSNAIQSQLVRALEFARVEAIELQIPVTVAPFYDGHIVTDWCHGVAIFKDPKQIGIFQNETQLMRVIQFIYPNNSSLTWNAFPSKPYLRFLSTGSSDYQNGTFHFFINKKEEWSVVVNQLGRVRVES